LIGCRATEQAYHQPPSNGTNIKKEIHMARKVALYLRVSTNEQTVKNQRVELMTVAKRQGWVVVETFTDEGISGAKGRDKRPGLHALMRGVARRDFEMVAAWSVDRLGRSLVDLLTFLSDLHAKQVDLYLHQQGLDTSTPSGKAMFQMLGVFAEFERAIIRERIKSGLARARADGKRFGRPRVAQATEDAIRAARQQGLGIRRIASDVGCGVSVVQRVVGELTRQRKLRAPKLARAA
jgi:DNA invertase Pin-like site-specific DNA recombinase